MNSRIKELRKENKYTRAELSEMADVSSNYIYLVEKGDKKPSDKMIRKLCEVFGVNDEWLRNGTGEKYAKMTKAQEIAHISKQLLSDDDPFKLAIVKMFSEMTNEQIRDFQKLFFKYMADLGKGETT